MFYVLLLLFSLSWTCAAPNIEFNIDMRKRGNQDSNSQTNRSNQSTNTLICNNGKRLTYEVQDGSDVQVIVRIFVTAINASCIQEKEENDTRIEKHLLLTKLNSSDTTQQQYGSTNTFMGSMTISESMQGHWHCSFVFQDKRFPDLAVPNSEENDRRIICRIELNVIGNFFNKYHLWIYVAIGVAALVVIVIIAQTIVILHFRARVNATKHIRPLSFITNRTDRNRYSTTPGRRHKMTRPTDPEPGIYESVENVNVASSPPIQDITQRPAFPLPMPQDKPYLDHEKEPFIPVTARPPPPPISSLPRPHRPLVSAPAEPDVEDFPPPLSPLPVEMKPVKAPDPMINELGNRLKKRRNVTAATSELQSPPLPKKNIKAPCMNSPQLPAKSHMPTHIRTQRQEMEPSNFFTTHAQMPAKSSPIMRSTEILNSKSPFLQRSRPYMPQHMQPDNSLHMQPSKGNLSLPKGKHGPPHMMQMQMRRPEHMRSTPDVNAALPRMPHMQCSQHMQSPSHMKFCVAPAVKIPPPVPRKTCLQVPPVINKPKFPSPRSSAIADYEVNSEDDEEWVYEDLEPMNLYNM